MSLLENLQWRHAVKAYDPTKKVAKEDLNRILEAARLAPTSSGLQPFRIISVENQELKEKMVAGALNPGVMRDCSHVLVFAAWDSYSEEKIDKVYMVGICTDICVISNALMIKNALLDTEVTVIEDLCKATSEAAHQTAIDAMKSCQVNVIKSKEL